MNEARKGSVTTTTEIIRVTSEPIKQLDDTDEKLQKLSEQIAQLEIQTNSVENGAEKSSPNNREKITPDKLPEDLGLTEVRSLLCFIFMFYMLFFCEDGNRRTKLDR